MSSKKGCPESSDSGGQGEADAADPDASDGLTAKQSKAVEALLGEPTLARAAVVAGVSERTLRRWQHEGAFRLAYYRARRDAFGQAIGLTQRYAPVAVATLVKVMNDAASPRPARR